MLDKEPNLIFRSRFNLPRPGHLQGDSLDSRLHRATGGQTGSNSGFHFGIWRRQGYPWTPGTHTIQKWKSQQIRCVFLYIGCSFGHPAHPCTGLRSANTENQRETGCADLAAASEAALSTSIGERLSCRRQMYSPERRQRRDTSTTCFHIFFNSPCRWIFFILVVPFQQRKNFAFSPESRLGSKMQFSLCGSVR